MKAALDTNVFGQHLVIDTVWNAIVAHWKSPGPKKPLVMSFHGYTGTGKNYVARQVVENLYRYFLYCVDLLLYVVNQIRRGFSETE